MTPKQRRDRVHQVGRYLREKYPLVYPVTIRVELCPVHEFGHRGSGECWMTGTRFTIRINPCTRIVTMVDTLCHEWGHLLPIFTRADWDATSPPHPDAFWRAYGRIYRDMIDGDGWEDSKEY